MSGIVSKLSYLDIFIHKMQAIKKIVWLLKLLPLFTLGQLTSVIPQPASLEIKNGSFTITPNTYLLAIGSGIENSVNFINNYLKKYYGFQLKKEIKPRLLNVVILNYERIDNSLPGASLSFRCYKK